MKGHNREGRVALRITRYAKAAGGQVLRDAVVGKSGVAAVGRHLNYELPRLRKSYACAALHAPAIASCTQRCRPTPAAAVQLLHHGTYI